MRPYVQQMEMEWIEVQPSEIIRKVSGYVTRYYHDRLNKVRRYGFLRNRKNVHVRIQDLNEDHAQVAARRKKGGAPYLYQATRQINLAGMALHAQLSVERQGIDAFLRFVEPKLGQARMRVDASFVNDPLIRRAYGAAGWKVKSRRSSTNR